MLNEGWRRKERGHRRGDRLGPGARPAADRRPGPRPSGLPPQGGRVPGQAFEEMAWRACWPADRNWSWWTSWPTPTSRGRPTPSAGRTSSPAGRRINVISTVNLQHLESLNDVVERITGVASRRRCRTGWCGRRTRSSWWTWPPRHCAAGWPTATSTRPSASTPPSATTSARATSPRCASWPCCGWPTRGRGAPRLPRAP